MEKRWKVASVAGIPIYITIPWLAFAALVIWGTYSSLVRTAALSDQQALGWSLANAAFFYASIILHELAHAATARAFSLPVHGITLVFWGGYTETHSGERGPLASFLISAAGPFSTLVLAGVFGASAESTDGVLSAILANLAFLSLLFAGLNALPGFPLDGGRMLLAVVWAITKDRFVALRVAGWGGVVVGAALGVVGFQLLRAGNPNWLFFGFIGWMMITQGLQVTRQSPVMRDLSAGQVSQAMGPPPAPIPSDASLLHVLDTHLRADRTTEFPVLDDEGRFVGALSFETAAKVGGTDPTRGVSVAMTPPGMVRTLQPDLSLDRALEWIAGKGQALVLDDGRVIGELTTRDVDRWYRRHVLGDSVSDETGRIPPRPDLGGVGDWG
ncbi:MAG TPA: site-2 protease family protein [Actinomycetota bacterium]|nr:site-2 protease family protein [Actinomycetota bacterium]